MARVVTLLMLVSLLLPAASAADDIMLRTAVEPAEPWVGQRVVLQVDVLSADGWAQISRFGDVDLPGAYLIRTESQGTRLQESIDGVSYTGQRYEVSVYPQVAGVIDVPAIPVEVTIKTWGTDAKQQVQQRQTPAVTIKAKLPPGAEGVRGLISTTRLSAEQDWAPTIDAPKVGDALTRTVTLQAADVSAMAFAPLDYADMSGVGIYPGEPTVTDSTDRGSLTGKRIEALTYVFERAGAIRIPDIVLSWWNVSADKLETVTLPGREIDVKPASAGGPSAGSVSPIERPDWRGLVFTGVVLLVPAYLLLRARKTLVRRWRAWRRRRKESEERYFRLAVRSIRSADAHRALRDTMHWLDRLDDTGPPAQLQEFLHRHGDANASAVIDQLMHAVAADNRLPDPAALIDSLKKAREHWHEADRGGSNSQYRLPGLNNG